jgi:rod shape-determining protein MreD
VSEAHGAVFYPLTAAYRREGVCFVRWFWIVLAGFILLVLDVAAMPPLRLIGGGPDLALLLVIFLALYAPVDDATIAGWLIGLMKDSLSTGPFGVYTVTFMCVGFFLSRVRSDIFTESMPAHAANAGAATLAAYMCVCAWRWMDGSIFAAMAPTAVGVALWNAAFAPLVFGVLFRFGRRLGASRRPE